VRPSVLLQNNMQYVSINGMEKTHHLPPAPPPPLLPPPQLLLLDEEPLPLLLELDEPELLVSMGKTTIFISSS